MPVVWLGCMCILYIYYSHLFCTQVCKWSFYAYQNNKKIIENFATMYAHVHSILCASGNGVRCPLEYIFLVIPILFSRPFLALSYKDSLLNLKPKCFLKFLKTKMKRPSLCIAKQRVRATHKLLYTETVIFASVAISNHKVHTLRHAIFLELSTHSLLP